MFQLLDALGLESIAFPAIGTGTAHFDYAEVSAIMADVISRHLANDHRERTVIIYLYDNHGRMQLADYISFFEEFALRLPHLAKAQTEVEIKKSKQYTPISPGDTLEEIRAKRLNFIRKNLLTLEERRNRLEEKLIDALDGDPVTYNDIEVKLKKNEKLRLAKMKELKDLMSSSSQPEPSVPSTVFLSSTYLDLKEHREAVKEQIQRRGLRFIGMEDFGARSKNSPATSFWKKSNEPISILESSVSDMGVSTKQRVFL